MKRSFSIFIPILILTDQAIKIPISRLLTEHHECITLIKGVLFFCPKQNTHGGWIPSMLDFIVPAYITIPITVFAVLLMIAAYRFMSYCTFNWDKYKNLPAIFLIMMLSGGFCSFIDDIFWGGSIDYIRLFDWFIFDLKDVYLTSAEVIVIIYLIVFIIYYYRLSKEERKEYDKKINMIKWLKSGMQSEHKKSGL